MKYLWIAFLLFLINYVFLYAVGKFGNLYVAYFVGMLGFLISVIVWIFIEDLFDKIKEQKIERI